MSEIVFLLEEYSAQAMLEGLLPRLLPPQFTVRYIVFEGKQDLLTQLVRRLRGYQGTNVHFVILRDKDAADCKKVKQELRKKCVQAGKPNALVRIACHELDGWYLADLSAVSSGLEIGGLAKEQNRSKFRVPDDLANAAEELGKLTKGVYQKIAGSRAIGPLLDLDNSRSRSFSVFVAGIRRLISDEKSPPR
ncbi:MAG: DUF4276 family protein [Planctomycetota bacterium]|nr:DUF4276 family protein [Planctomycetota bacterium]